MPPPDDPLPRSGTPRSGTGGAGSSGTRGTAGAPPLSSAGPSAPASARDGDELRRATAAATLTNPGGTVDEGDEANHALPPVVAVVVAHEPGPWFDETLASLAGQTYEDLTVVVLVAPPGPPRGGGPAGLTDPALETRVRAYLPAARVRVLDRNVGFGPACNQVLATVQGAAFFLFCHDDVRLDPDTVSVLVGEAFRSNAGVVGPKLVDWDEPRRLRQVGMNVDKFGAPSPTIDPGELDQEQHDAVRDVFYVPGAVTLVRADLFATLGGFDPDIDLVGEDLDLCWRAHVAGARVLVAPRARVAHREALEDRSVGLDRRRLALAHRLRTMLVCYGRMHRWRVLPQALVLSAIEGLASLVTGHLAHARDVLAAWPAVLASRSSIRRARGSVRSTRVVGDGEIRQLQVRGSAGANQFVRTQLESVDDEHFTVAGASRDLAQRMHIRSSRLAVAAVTAVVAVLLFGSRELLTQPIPSVGQFVPFTSGPLDLFRTWTGGYNANGLGTLTPSPTGLGFLSVASAVLLGAEGFLRWLLIVGLVPLGLLGVWRLTREAGPRPAAVALLVYGTLPLAANCFAHASWSGLALFGLAPWMVRQLALAAPSPPLGLALRAATRPAGAPDPRVLVHRVLALGFLTAVGMFVEPFTVVLVPVMAAALALGDALAGRARDAGTVVLVGLVSGLVAFVLHLPWSFGLITGGWSDASGAAASGPALLDLGQLVRFVTGPVADSVLVAGYLGVAGFALVIGRSWRLAWAVRGWALVLVAWVLAWLSTQAGPASVLPVTEVLLAPGAVGLALAAGMGAAAFDSDLPDYHFGWRQVAAVVAGAALVVAALPAVVASLDGRWHLPRGDFRNVLANLETSSPDFRTLWIGDASVLPVQGWPVDIPALSGGLDDQRLVYATTVGREPRVENLWPGTRGGATEALGRALEAAAQGHTTHLGALLAPMGIEYLVVPSRAAPPPYVLQDTSHPDALIDVLAAQLDLSRVDLAVGIHVYRNTAWGPTTALLPAGTPVPPGGPALADQVVPGLAGAPDALPDRSSDRSFAGPIPQPSEVWVGSGGGDAWQLQIDGEPVPRRQALGWASVFSVDRAGSGDLHLATPVSGRLLHLIELALWFGGLAVVWRETRRARAAARRRRRRAVT